MIQPKSNCPSTGFVTETKRRTFTMFGRIFLRRLSSLAEPLPKASQGQYPVPNSSRYRKLQELQTRFCQDDGLLVWQKQPADVTLYRISCILVVTGVVLTFDTLRRMAAPPKNE
ncbi:uncharacterized protein LOC101848729 isoform X2 [Aplysia californica]|uniref:Uncharacterized protein LOC101848729 isoform X2 n=1 Tax=Aplysia californica TaxID=6500 RepID=A0ABM0ZV21_APLCA|nr:uncharacterized protein LOC101848729 isoform X2 [Aplysia californica]